MAIGWTTIPTVNDRPKEEKTYRLEKDPCRKVVTKDFLGLKKEGEDLYEQAVLEEEKLLTAFKEKKVKSKAAIRKAKSILSKREKAATQ